MQHYIRIWDSGIRDGGPDPVLAIQGIGIANLISISAVQPHFEEPVAGVEPHAIAERHGKSRGVQSARRDDGVQRIHHSLVLRARHAGLLDQKIIDKQLAAQVDGNHRRRIRDI